MAVQERDLNADDDFGDTNEVVYYHANTLSSVYALTDADGTVIERYRYDAYGGATVLDADGSVDGDGVSDVKNPYAYTGRRADLETGNSQLSTALMQYRYRYYSPVLGRFISRDPARYVDGYSMYAYVSGRATGARDGRGLAAGFEGYGGGGMDFIGGGFEPTGDYRTFKTPIGDVKVPLYRLWGTYEYTSRGKKN